MKKSVLPFIAALALLLPSCRLQNAGEVDYRDRCAPALTADGKTVDDFCYGVYGLYPFEVPRPSRCPAGYHPVYISHYGRHGSRYLQFDSIYVQVNEVLQRAHADSMLTDVGEKVYDSYCNIAFPALNGRSGEITSIGQIQHREIARRMMRNYRHVFIHNNYVVANSTNLERTIMSMDAFTGQLQRMSRWLRIDSDASRLQMYYLNPHSPENPQVTQADLDFKSQSAAWRPEYRKYCAEHIDWRAFAGRLFKDVDYAHGICDVVDFEKNLYYVAIHYKGTPEGFTPLGGGGWFYAFTLDELHSLAECGDNYTYYIEKSRYPLADGRGWALSASLLEDIIVKADEDLGLTDSWGLRPAARLRFGHDGCIMAMFALMELPGWDAAETDPAKFKDVWDASQIMMASNVQLVFYRSLTHHDGIIFKMMLNEQDMELPLEPVSGRFYRWNDFKDKYLPKIKSAREILEQTQLR